MDVEEGEAKMCRLCGQYERIYIDVFGEEGVKRYLGLKIHRKINILIKEDDSMPQQICRLCFEKFNFTCAFYDNCHEIQKKLWSTIKETNDDDNVEEKENTISPMSNVKRRIRTSSENLSKNTHSNNTDSLIIDESPKKHGTGNYLRRSCLREICPNAQTATSLWAQEQPIGIQENKRNALAQKETVSFEKTMKQENDIKEYSLSENSSSRVLPASLLNNSTVWIHSLDWSLSRLSREADKPKNVTNIAVNNSPPPGDEAESKSSNFESSKLAMPDNIEKPSPIVPSAPKKACLESNTIFLHNSENTALSGSLSSSIINECKVHIWAHLNIKPYKCKKCSFSTVTLSNVRCHIRKSHLKIKPFTCKLCSKQYATFALLKEHVNIHIGVRPYKCEMCNFSSTSRQALNNHMGTHMSSKDIPCNICDKIFHSRLRMRAHMRIHNENNVTCDICRVRLSNEKALETHCKKVHVQDYICKICNKVYKSRKALHNHMNAHKEAKYKCTKCPKAYKSKHILNEHLLKHEGIRKYKCFVCEKSFAQQSHLAAHNKVHNPPSYECPGCGRKHNRRDNMKTHMTRCKSCQ